MVGCPILWADNRDEMNQSTSHKRGAISEFEEWIIALGLECVNFSSVSSYSWCRLNRPFATNDHMVQKSATLEGKLIIIPALAHQNKCKSSFTDSGLFVLMSLCGNNNEFTLQRGGFLYRDRLLQKAYSFLFRDISLLWGSGKLLSLLYHVSMLTNFDADKLPCFLTGAKAVSEAFSRRALRWVPSEKDFYRRRVHGIYGCKCIVCKRCCSLRSSQRDPTPSNIVGRCCKLLNEVAKRMQRVGFDIGNREVWVLNLPVILRNPKARHIGQ